MKSPHDKVYAAPRDMIVDFVFDETVARVFPDMVRRSVPGYDTIIPLIGLLAEQYARPHSIIYDLGCSLGAATLSMRRRVRQPDCQIVAVDNSPAMVAQCQEHVAADPSPLPVEVICADLEDITVRNASVVVLNFTLQFIAPGKRLAILQGICDGLQPGGVLVLSEKLDFDDPQAQQTLTRLHEAFKRANGYSELEISQKRSALEKVLLPETLDQHRQRLYAAGFSQVLPWFQCLNFASLLAVK